MRWRRRTPTLGAANGGFNRQALLDYIGRTHDPEVVGEAWELLVSRLVGGDDRRWRRSALWEPRGPGEAALVDAARCVPVRRVSRS